MRKLCLLTSTATYCFVLLCFLLTCVIPPGALAAPLVAITTPQDGSTVSGETWIDVSYRGEHGLPVVAIQLYLDGRQVQEWRLTTPQVEGKQSFKWNFSLSTQETHVISAKAIDAQGAEANATITVRVERARAADNVPPIIRIYYPAQGAKLSGKVMIKAEATDNVGVTEVFFYIDGRLKAMIMNAPPFVTEWDTTKMADGPHVLQASAWDETENEGRSAEVTVFVENRSLTTADQGLGTEEVAPPIEIPAPPEVTAAERAPAPQPEATASGPALAMRVTPPIAPVVPTAPRYSEARAPSPASAPTLAALPPALPPAALETRITPPSRTVLPSVVPRPEVAPQVQPAPQERGGPGLVLATRQVPATPIPAAAAQATAAPVTLGAERLTKPWYGTPRLNVSPARNTPPSGETELVARAPVVPPVTAPVPAVPPQTLVAPRYQCQAQQMAAVSTSLAGYGAARIGLPAGLPAAKPQGTMALAEETGSGYQVAMLPRTEPMPGEIQPRTDSPTVTVSPPAAIAEIRDVQIVFNGEQLELRALPETKHGISLAPLREIFEHTDGVLYWYPIEKKVRAVNQEVDLRLQIGNQEIQVNEETRTLELAPYIRQGRTMVPLQFLADTLDVTITYNPDSGQIVISSNQF